MILFCALCFIALQGASAVTIQTVPIGNPGNANDPATGNHYGSVAYNYSIGKYDVTVGQYTAFLNAVAGTDTYGLYNTFMAADLNVAGIAQSGSSGRYNYSVIGSPNHPIAHVTWGGAARFANWVNNGQPSGSEGPGTTETGAYSLNGAVTSAALNAVTRSAGATWVLPTESEWYKAAYYDPVAGHYWNYATGTNVMPASAPPGSTPNTANYRADSGAYAVTGSTIHSSSQNYLTDVGAYTLSASRYGTFDQTGDVFQWNEAVVVNGGPTRGIRGGSWNNPGAFLASSEGSSAFPAGEGNFIGFRLAETPEPSTGVLAILACGSLWWWRKRFK
ncbi:MAG TPA: SUMF1/EgtB/PvdO family nonheme iron enzyme [Pirellulales bacterium]|nr:SUMF1/EgtB/PvdO family nonheme iron enzyme [Pirellulales bacterium]